MPLYKWCKERFPEQACCLGNQLIAYEISYFGNKASGNKMNPDSCTFQTNINQQARQSLFAYL